MELGSCLPAGNHLPHSRIAKQGDLGIRGPRSLSRTTLKNSSSPSEAKHSKKKVGGDKTTANWGTWALVLGCGEEVSP